jgi:hypothetical protein
MIGPHQRQFPHRITILVLGCVLTGVVAALWPRLTLNERPLMPLLSLYGVADGFFTYGLLLMLLRFVPSLHTIFALFLFYGALAGLLVFLIQVAAQIVSPPTALPYQEAATFAVTVSGSLGIAAAAFSALNRDGTPSNQRLERP